MKEWQANYEHTCGIHENKWDFADPINCVRSSPNATSLTGCLTDLAIDSLLEKCNVFEICGDIVDVCAPRTRQGHFATFLDCCVLF